MREYTCSYANCQKTKVPILVTFPSPGGRPRFCCEEHAASYFVRCAHIQARGLLKEAEWAALDHDIRLVVGDGK